MQFIINAVKHIKARAIALRNGILLETFQGGFLLKQIRSGEYLNDMEPNEITLWDADDVLEYCEILKQGMRTGMYCV